MRKRTLFKLSLITILCIAIIISTLRLTASADGSAPTADLIHIMTDITSDQSGTKIGDVTLDNISENASLSLSVGISAQNFSDNYNNVKTLEGLGVSSGSASTPLFFVSDKSQAGNISYSGIREADEIIVEFYTTFPLSVQKVTTLADGASSYTNLRVPKTGNYSNQLIFPHTISNNCGYRPVIYNGDMFHLDSHFNDPHHVTNVNFSNMQDVGLTLTIDNQPYSPYTNSSYVGDNAFNTPMYKHTYTYDVSALTDINNVNFNLTAYDDVLAHTYDDSGLSTSSQTYNIIYGISMIRFNGLKMDPEESTSEPSTSSSESSTTTSSSESSSSSSSSSSESSSSVSELSEESSTSSIPPVVSNQSDNNSFPSYQNEDSPLITGTSSTSSQDIEVVNEFTEKITPKENVKEEEKEEENSLLVMDNTPPPTVKETDDIKTAVDNNKDNESPIINNDASSETETFIPQLPASIAKANQPSVEKVVGSSAVVSAALAIYVIFYKKMIASIATSI